MRLKYIAAICLLYGSSVFAQQNAANKHYEKALEYKAAKNNIKAYEEMEAAIKDNPASSDPYSILGEWYFKAHKFKEAADVFSRASASCPNGAKRFALPLSRSLLYSYQPDRALQVITGYGTIKDRNEWKLLRESAYFMKQAFHPFNDTPMNMGIRINTQFAETFPCITADTQNLFFTRRLNGVDDDFYKSHVDSCGGWFTARNMGTPANTPNMETAQCISGDGHYLFFMRCDNHSENGWDQGGCDLFMAYTADSIWSTPENFGATINGPGYEGMPSLSPDNRELYFVSDREGGYGGLDIWMSRFENGLWQIPRNLGPEVNTLGNETAPFIHIDNNTLYFVSDGHPGMGGNDIYFCRRINDTTWAKPQNIGYPINTSNDENSLCVTIDGKRIYFASDRDSAAGNFDLYQYNLPAIIQPIPVVIIKGYSYDSLSKNRLNNTSIYIDDPGTGEHLYHYVSNRGDGSYMITLPAGKSYTIVSDRVGYLATTATIDLTGMKKIQDTVINISLLPNDYQKPINDSLIATLLFPINCKTFPDSLKMQLSQAMMPLLGEKGMVVIINGYTDNSGNPMLNEQLSYLRANLVSSEIQAMGIDPTAIDAKGWGEANPVAPNDSEENKNKNRRVEVIIRR
ncbi:MAG: PD40 domain-containing protein [Bacteroidetes bacterium]|nr:PD40 domain-containing protein [Bacteroidota bacterium]